MKGVYVEALKKTVGKEVRIYQDGFFVIVKGILNDDKEVEAVIDVNKVEDAISALADDRAYTWGKLSLTTFDSENDLLRVGFYPTGEVWVRHSAFIKALRAAARRAKKKKK